MNNMVGKVVGVIIVLLLIPTILAVLVQSFGLVLASLPWWVWVALIAGLIVLIMTAIERVRRFFRGPRPQHHIHDHYHHGGGYRHTN